MIGNRANETLSQCYIQPSWKRRLDIVKKKTKKLALWNYDIYIIILEFHI